jgi:hypothetical protein
MDTIETGSPDIYITFAYFGAFGLLCYCSSILYDYVCVLDDIFDVKYDDIQYDEPDVPGEVDPRIYGTPINKRVQREAKLDDRDGDNEEDDESEDSDEDSEDEPDRPTCGARCSKCHMAGGDNDTDETVEQQVKRVFGNIDKLCSSVDPILATIESIGRKTLTARIGMDPEDFASRIMNLSNMILDPATTVQSVRDELNSLKETVMHAKAEIPDATTPKTLDEIIKENRECLQAFRSKISSTINTDASSDASMIQNALDTAFTS